MLAKTIHTILQLKDKFTPTIRKINKGTKDTQKQVKMLNNTVTTFRTKTVGGFTFMARSAAGVTASFLGIAAAASGIASSVQFIKQYQDSMVNLQVQTGATGKELANMKKDVESLYKENIGTGLDDISTSMSEVKQITGQAGEELKNTTRQAVIFKDAFGVETAESIKTVDTMMKTFGITSEQAYDLLAQGQQKGLNKSGDMMDTINEYSNQFKSLGYNVEDMFDTLYAGKNAGAFSIDFIADAMKEANIRLKDGSKTSAAAFKTIGLDGQKMTRTFAAGGAGAKKAMAEVFAALQSIKDPVAQNEAAVGLFGTKFEDLEKDVLFSMGNVEKTFKATGQTMKDVANVKYTTLGASIQGIKRSLETGILVPIAKNILPKLNEFGGWIKSHMPKIQNEIKYAFGVGTGVIEKFKEALGWAKDNASWLIPVVTGLTAAIVAQKVVGVVSNLFATWSKVTKGLTLAQIALNAVMALNPFGLIAIAIGVVVAAGVALWKNWDTVKLKATELVAWLGSAWDGLKIKTTEVWTSISNWLGSFPFGQAMLESVRLTIENTKLIFSGIIDFIKNIFAGNWSAAWNGIVETFKGVFGNIATHAKAPINSIIEMVNGLIAKINGINVSIPDWVPGDLGGKSFGVNIPSIPQFATGTQYFKGGLAQTDERGGEIKQYPNGTKVIPHDLSKRMLKDSGVGGGINITIQGNVIGNEDFAKQLGSYIFDRIRIASGNV